MGPFERSCFCDTETQECFSLRNKLHRFVFVFNFILVKAIMPETTYLVMSGQLF